jgi:hypothetical protein
VKRFVVVLIITVFITSCSTPSATESVETAVAETAAAMIRADSDAPVPTETPEATEIPAPTLAPTLKATWTLVPIEAEPTETLEPTEIPAPTVTPGAIATLSAQEIEQMWYLPVGVAYTHYQLQCVTLANPSSYDDYAEQAEINFIINLISSFDGPRFPIFSLLATQQCAYTGDFCENVAESCVEVKEYRDRITQEALQDGLSSGTISRLYDQFTTEFIRER